MFFERIGEICSTFYEFRGWWNPLNNLSWRCVCACVISTETAKELHSIRLNYWIEGHYSWSFLGLFFWESWGRSIDTYFSQLESAVPTFTGCCRWQGRLWCKVRVDETYIGGFFVLHTFYRLFEHVISKHNFSFTLVLQMHHTLGKCMVTTFGFSIRWPLPRAQIWIFQSERPPRWAGWKHVNTKGACWS